MFSTRLATAAALLAVFVAALLYLPNQWWGVFLLPILAGASWEWGRLTRAVPVVKAGFCALVLGSALALWLGGRTKIVAGLDYAAIVLAISCVFWLFVAPLWLVLRWRIQSLQMHLVTGWIVIVPTWLALFLLQARPAQLLALLGVVWLADTGAYVAGKAFGRHKLAVTISPGKTWEGVAGAVVAVAVYYGLFSLWLHEWPWWSDGRGAILFGSVAALSIVGDLFESWMKRQAGTKDSGTLLPGHGGILDRIDSMTSSMPFAAGLLLWMK